MSAARSAAERVREFVRGGGTGDAGLDHDLMLLAGEVTAPTTPLLWETTKTTPNYREVTKSYADGRVRRWRREPTGEWWELPT